MIAQFATPPEGLSFDYFVPLVLLGLLYLVVFVAARLIAGREGEEAAAPVELAAFVLMLIAGVYTAVLAIYALAQRSDVVADLASILAIVGVFFAALLLVLLGVELMIGALSRRRSRRRRERVAPPAQP